MEQPDLAVLAVWADNATAQPGNATRRFPKYDDEETMEMNWWEDDLNRYQTRLHPEPTDRIVTSR